MHAPRSNIFDVKTVSRGKAMKSHILHLVQKIAYLFLFAAIPASSVLAVPSQVPLETKEVGGAGIDPNVMILLDTSLSMDSKDGTGFRRITRAKNALRNIVQNTDNVYFCLATFDQRRKHPYSNDKLSNGAYMNSNRICGTDKQTLIAELNNIEEGHRNQYSNCKNNTTQECYARGTPTASALYDITRYFSNPTAAPFFGKFDNHAQYPDPILGPCQQNIVVISTDGFSYADWQRVDDSSGNTQVLPLSALPKETISAANAVDGRSHELPRWADGYAENVDLIPGKANSTCRGNSKSPDTPPGTNPNPKFQSSCLDDLALYANQLDLKTGTSNGFDWDAAPFERQSLEIHTIGLNINGAILQSAADLGGGTYKTTDTASSIESAFEEIISGIAKVSGSASDITASGTSFFVAENGIDFYITSYNTDGWFGELYSYNVTESAPGVINSNAGLNWKASEHIPPVATRKVFTNNLNDLSDADTAVLFQTASLSDSQMIDIGVDPILLGRATDDPDDPVYPTAADIATALTEQTARVDRVVSYIKGDGSNEKSLTGGTQEFRDRTRLIGGISKRNILGDLIHSRPTFIHHSDYGYADSDYGTFLDSNAINTRKAMVYVGGNDGMLHAIDAESGVEKFAYIPSTLISKIRALSEQNFDENHQIYVDGIPTGTDAKLDNDWSTVFASPFGAGGKGLFLLDVTNPESDIDTLYRWEINNDSPDYSDMGFILNQSKITRVLDDSNNEHWVLITGNGVHSENGAAVIYVINLDDGTLFQNPIVIDSGLDGNGDKKYATLDAGNGVTDVAAVGASGGSFATKLYASTLKGEVWSLDYNPSSGSDGKFEFHFEDANSGADVPLFTAYSPDRFDYDRDGNTSELVSQPITGEIVVTAGPSDDVQGARGGFLVSFGTGRYFSNSDIEQENNLKVQSFYTIWDTDSDDNGDYIDGNLTRLDLVEQTVTNQYDISGHTNAFRDSSKNPVDWGNDRGWYIDLVSDFGERIIGRPLVLFERIGFKSIVPTQIIQDVSGFNPITDVWLSSSNGGINSTAQCNIDASGIHGWYMQFNRNNGYAPLGAEFSVRGDPGLGIAGESTAGNNIFQNPIIIQTTDGRSRYVNIDVDGDVTELLSSARFERSSWRRLQ